MLSGFEILWPFLKICIYKESFDFLLQYCSLFSSHASQALAIIGRSKDKGKELGSLLSM